MTLRTKTTFPTLLQPLSQQELACIKGGCCNDKRRPIKTKQVTPNPNSNSNQNTL